MSDRYDAAAEAPAIHDADTTLAIRDAAFALPSHAADALDGLAAGVAPDPSRPNDADARDFAARFGRPPTVSAAAFGRVNLIGEHTEYNGGFVLPTLIPQQVRVMLAPRSDGVARVFSAANHGAGEEQRYLLGEERPGRDWLDYVQGVTWVMRQHGCRLGGFDALIASSLPLGVGLSSSAALAVGLTRALRLAFDAPLDDLQIARLEQELENDFVGARVGIMDPLVISLADQGEALFLDCRSLQYERVPMPANADLVVLDSGVSHRIVADSGDGRSYNARRAECERACALLGIAELRDLDVMDLPRLSALPQIEQRRARHVVTENARVVEAVAALRQGDLERLGTLFAQSHDSMRDDYDVSTPEIDLIVELARAEPDIYGARLTGGGFGGSVVMLARKDQGHAAGERIAAEYARRSGRTPTLLVPAEA